MGRRLAWAVAAAVAVWLGSSGASAQQRLVIDADTGAVTASCDTIAGCTVDGDCATASSELGQKLTCSTDLLGEGRCLLSSDAKTELLCCAQGGVGACPDRLGTTGECVPVGDTGVSVCVYPELFPICPDPDPTIDGLTLTSVSTCFLTTNATNAEYTADWRLGDCDQDGTPNGVDCAPCDHNVQQCPTVDAGVEDDAGRPIDWVDGGDINPPGPDAGTGKDPVSFRGDGGCQCRAVHTGDLAGGLVPSLLVLGLLAIRRRRHL